MSTTPTAHLTARRSVTLDAAAEPFEALELVYADGPDVVPVGLVIGDDLWSLCRRCGPTGWYGHYSYNTDAESSRCYECHGRGVGTRQTPAVLALRGRAKADRLVAERAEKQARAERRGAELAEYADVLAYLHGHEGADGFIGSIADRAAKVGVLTPRQVEAAREVMQREQAKAGAENQPPAPVPTGRVEVVGVIVSDKWADSPWGATRKMLVQSDEGWRVYGTCPDALACAPRDWPAGQDHPPVRGRRVRFVAAVEPSSNEPTFGWFKRPTHAEVIAYTAA